ncbi:MAG: FmdB family zinc ribbon protein [Gemmatimonadaceae bacterium]
MPTYQFRAPNGTIIERVFKISDVPDTIPAPDGSGEAVRIISGGAGLIFKGSGFYITDYGKDGKKDQRDAASKAETKSEAKGEAKGDSKPVESAASNGGAKSDGASSAAAPSSPGPAKE